MKVNDSRIIKKVETALRATRGVVDVKWLTPAHRKHVLDLEEQVSSQGLGGAGNYYNEGITDVLSRGFVCVLLNNNEFRHAASPSLFWVAGNTVIGEEVTDIDRLRELAQKKNIKILRKNFVVHFDRIKETRGQAPVFVVRGLPFPEIEGIAEIREVISASPIGSADVFLKEHFDWDVKARDLGTILIGFNLV